MLKDKEHIADYLKNALELASARRGFCAPNPSVGAVLVQDNQILATGYHRGCGYAHAEVEAINRANNVTQAATLYVTLEPCCHTAKKTPPCTDLLIQKGISQVIYGYQDPNPAVSGKSEKVLQAANIKCIQHQLPEIDEFYESYHYWWQHKKPFVTAKIALSLDGKIAATPGKRTFITGQAAEQFTHQQRKTADALLTTAKTILADNPRLDVRLGDTHYKKPVYILDSQCIVPRTAHVFNHASSITIFYNAHLKKINQPANDNVRYIPIQADNGLNLHEVMHHIGQDGIHDLWVEAGGRCFAALLQAKLVQRAFVYVAPKWLGEQGQTAFTGHENIFATAQSVKWFLLEQDAVCEWRW